VKKTDSLRQRLRHALRLDRAVLFVWQAGSGWTIVGLSLVLLQGILPLLALYLMKLIVDAVTFALETPDSAAAFRHVAFLIGIAAGVAFLNVLFQLMAGLVREAQSLKVTDHMYDILHAKSVEVDLEYYENPAYFDTLHRAQKEGPYRPTHILDGLVGLGRSGISLLAMVGLLFAFHWAVAVVLFLAAVPGILVRLKYSGRMYQWTRERTPEERKAAYINWILTGDNHAKEIRLFDLGDLFIKRFGDVRRKLRRERFEITRKRSTAELAAQTGGLVAVFCSFGFIVYRTVQGVITLGDMVMYYQAFQRGLGYLRDVLRGLADLYEDNLFLYNLYEFLDLKPKVREPSSPRAVPRPIQTGIVFDHVTFQYPTGTREVLKDVCLSIEPGQVVALVGENGSGKSTLIKLLCRLYDPTKGSVTIDGIDLREFETAALRREISVIFQDYAHYHVTARENIWFGNTELSPEHRRVSDAAVYSGADELIRRLPKGYETVLGRWFEEGEELSIGEWQMIALARAFLRDAQMIVLDEPTSAMDAKSEYEVFRRFRELLEGRSAVLISHRFSTVQMADRIYLLEGGRVTESGTHKHLVDAGGVYAGLFEKQVHVSKT